MASCLYRIIAPRYTTFSASAVISPAAHNYFALLTSRNNASSAAQYATVTSAALPSVTYAATHNVVDLLRSRTHAASTTVQQSTALHTTQAAHKVVPVRLKKRSKTAHEWLSRQLNDPYVKKARKESYRARSAFKLLEIQDRINLLRPGQGVLECGCAPGAWTQVLVHHCNTAPKMADKPQGRVVGVDLLTTAPLPGVHILNGTNFTAPETRAKIMELLHPYELDLVLSDMAPNASGIKDMDHEQIMRLVFAVAHFAKENARQGSDLLCKVWSGVRLRDFRAQLSVLYDEVRVVKPPCSRDNSAECYVYAKGLKEGGNKSLQLQNNENKDSPIQNDENNGSQLQNDEGKPSNVNNTSESSTSR